MAARGGALFFGTFTVVNLLRGLFGPGMDANHWWLDLRVLPDGLETMLFGALGGVMLHAALRPTATGRLLRLRRVALLAAAGVALFNAIQVLRLLAVGDVGLFPVPFSVAVAIVLAWLALRSWPAANATRPRPWWNGVRITGIAGAAALSFALAQMVCFGLTDYRRPAAAIVVLGARAYADGSASHALRDRVLTACELYHEGLAPRIVMSGGPGDGVPHETEVMRDLAVAHGVPSAAIELDRDGVSSRATVRNVTSLLRRDGRNSALVVSHAYHLPRLKMAFERLGLRTYTVPAEQRDPLHAMPWFLAREVAALWAYYVAPPKPI